MQLEYPVYKKLHKFIVLSAVVALVVSLLQRQNGKSCEPGAKMEEKTESVNAAIMLWSPCQEQWVQERAAATSKANKKLYRFKLLVSFIV